MPTVAVLYFAQVRDRLGRDHDDVTLPDQVNADMVIAAVVSLHPQHEQLLHRCRVAIDHTFISAPVVINERSEIALIPPVSGG